jgi:hypothetical protein
LRLRKLIYMRWPWGQNDSFVMPNKSFVVPDESFVMPNKSFVMPNKSFVVPDESFVVPDESFVVPNESFVVPNESFVVPNESFVVPNESFVVPNESNKWQNETCSASLSEFCGVGGAVRERRPGSEPQNSILHVARLERRWGQTECCRRKKMPGNGPPFLPLHSSNFTLHTPLFTLPSPSRPCARKTARLY